MHEVAAAMENARVETDERGLMPLREARKRVAALEVYRKGDGTMLDGSFVLESDVAWAALLSLADAEEFVREATRIRFEFHVRGRDNVAAVERYGDGVLPWIAANVDARGVLRNVPWCLLPCLLAIDGEEALSLALRIRGVTTDERIGPGAYAADSEGDVDREGSTLVEEDTSVARSWVARGDRMKLLERRAASGDARAKALLAELRPPLDPKIDALLAATPKLDVPHGPAVSILELDEMAREYLFPIWDNANYTTGAMRATGFVSAQGDALVLEVITHWPSASQGFAREITVFGPGARTKSLQKELVGSKQLDLWLDGDSTRVNRVTGVIVRGETEKNAYREIVVTPPSGINPTVRITIGNESVNLWTTFPEIPDLDDEKRAFARRIDPSLVVLFQLAEPALRDKLFLSAAALAKAIGVPDDAQVLFSFDDWEHPAAGELASSSIDFVTMVAALGARARLDRLLGKPNCRFHHWLEHLATHRCDPSAWGTGNPIDEEKPTSGVSINPQHDALMDRGWPHLVSLVHDHPWNEPKKAAAVAEEILREGRSMFRVTWAREIAFRTARALGASRTTIDPKAPEVREALSRGGPIGSKEARTGLAHAVARKVEVPAALVEDHVLILEATIGPEVVIDGVLGALGKIRSAEKAPPNALAALDALGFVIERAPADVAETARERVAALAERWGGDAPLTRLAHLLSSGERRGAIPEAWLAHVLDAPEVIRAQVASSKEPLVPDARLVTLAGPQILDSWLARLDTLAGDPRWAVIQIGMLGDPRAGDLLRAFVERGIAEEDARTWLGYRPAR